MARFSDRKGSPSTIVPARFRGPFPPTWPRLTRRRIDTNGQASLWPPRRSDGRTFDRPGRWRARRSRIAAGSAIRRPTAVAPERSRSHATDERQGRRVEAATSVHMLNHRMRRGQARRRHGLLQCSTIGGTASAPSAAMTSASPAFNPAAPAAAVAADRERHFWPAVWALGVGSFAIGTGEFVIMGLLPEVARGVGVTIPQAGHVISAYALGVVIGAPVLAVLAANWPRRALLIALMALFAAGNFASAAAPGYVSLMLLRFIAGLPHGTYFGVAALVAASLAPPNRRASAVGLVMSGLTSATLLGVPIAAWLGQHLGWRAAFVLVGAIGALAAWLVRRHVPDLPAPRGASAARELGALARPQVWLTLGIASIGFGGMFAVYSYIKPTLMEVTGLPLDAVPLELALFGAGMVLGNLAGARLADKSV